MAEVGLIGTIVGIASAGIKLSITLYSFSETVSTAHVEIKNIARDVSLTSAVLEELGASLKQDDQAKLYSGSALRTAKEVVKECEGIFNDINSVMGKAIDSASKRGTKKGKLALSAIEKLKWPFLQPKMEMLRGNLERLKSTLVLMLNVLSYARDLRAEKKEPPMEDDSYQKMLLESLLRANQEATRNYEVLLKTISPQADNREKQGQSRSLESGSSTLRDEASSTGTPFISLAKSGTLDENLNSTRIVEGNATQESEIESTIRACINDIENALVKFEQSHITIQAQPQITVQIEVQKRNITAGVDARSFFTPWKFISITQKRELGLPSTANASSTETSSFGFGAAPAGLPVADHPSISPDTTGHPSKDARTAAFEIDIEEVASIIRENISHVIERGERLDSQNLLLQDQTENLAAQAQAFRRSANRRRAERPWYAAAWNSLPSTSDIFNPIQNSLPTPTTTVAYLWDALRSIAPFSSGVNRAVIAAPAPSSRVQQPNGRALLESDPAASGRLTTAETLKDFVAHQGTPSNAAEESQDNGESPTPADNNAFASSPDRENEAEAREPQLALQRKAHMVTNFQQARHPFLIDLDWEDDEDVEKDSVHKLLTEWTTLFDDEKNNSVLELLTSELLWK